MAVAGPLGPNHSTLQEGHEHCSWTFLIACVNSFGNGCGGIVSPDLLGLIILHETVFIATRVSWIPG